MMVLYMEPLGKGPRIPLKGLGVHIKGPYFKAKITVRGSSSKLQTLSSAYKTQVSHKGFRVPGLGFRVLGFRVQGLGV